jgi:transposase-like protein
MELHKLRSTESKFSEEVKLKSVKMYLLEGVPKVKIIRWAGVTFGGLDKWINKYGERILSENYPQEIDSLVSSELVMSQTKSKDPEDLHRQIQELQKKLERANLKVSLLETMIDIAENDLHIPIRKKSGSQPSKEKHTKKK